MVYDINVEKEGQECKDELLVAQHMCVFVFLLTIFTEVKESIHLLELIFKHPIQPEHYINISVHDEHGAVLEDENRNVFHRLGKWGKQKMVSSNEVHNQWTLDRMGYKWKAFSIIFVGIPKLAIGLLLAWLGASYIVKSGDGETMMLNTLAVLFVIDIDEYIYNAFVLSPVRAKLEGMKELEMNPHNMERVLLFIFNSFVYPIFIALG